MQDRRRINRTVITALAGASGEIISTASAMALAVVTWSPVNLHNNLQTKVGQNEVGLRHMDNNSRPFTCTDSPKGLWTRRVENTGEATENEIFFSILSGETFCGRKWDSTGSETDDTEALGGEFFRFDEEGVHYVAGQRKDSVGVCFGVWHVGDGCIKDALNLMLDSVHRGRKDGVWQDIPLP